MIIRSEEICKKANSMIVSRGLGNSIIPFRVNNRPEVVLIELKSQNQCC